jgi:hypothetical protein
MTAVIPLSCVQEFFKLFWQDGWLAVYRVILIVLSESLADLMASESSLSVQLALQRDIGSSR